MFFFGIGSCIKYSPNRQMFYNITNFVFLYLNVSSDTFTKPTRFLLFVRQTNENLVVFPHAPTHRIELEMINVKCKIGKFRTIYKHFYYIVNYF